MNTRIKSSVVIIEDEKVLVVCMHRENAKDIFVFPGGGVNDKEGVFQAAIREAKEETNLDVSIKRIIYLKELHTDSDYSLEVIFLAGTKGGALAKGFDPEEKGKNVLKEVKFVELKDFENLNFHPKQLRTKLYKDYKNGFKNSAEYLGIFEYPEN